MQISFWERESFFKQQDIIIIGGGLAGLWCAYELKKQNDKLKILILEKGNIPEGASTRNAGFACFGSPTEILNDIKILGEKKALEITEMRFRGIEKIREVFSDEIIEFDSCGGFECLSSSVGFINIKEEIHELNKKISFITNDKNTFAFADKKLEKFGLKNFDHLIENKFEGGLHSGKFVEAFIKKIRLLGVEILNGIEVKSWEEKNNEIKIFTSKNICFTSSKLFITSNAFTSKILPHVSIIPARGQIIVTNEIKNLNLKGTFHFDGGFYYFRNIKNRILLGGARNKAFSEETTTDFDTTDIIQNELERFLSTHILPTQDFQIEFRWSGIMGFTKNKLPVIKNISKNITAIIACNGMGVALTPVIFNAKEYV